MWMHSKLLELCAHSLTQYCFFSGPKRSRAKTRCRVYLIAWIETKSCRQNSERRWYRETYESHQGHGLLTLTMEVEINLDEMN